MPFQLLADSMVTIPGVTCTGTRRLLAINEACFAIHRSGVRCRRTDTYHRARVEVFRLFARQEDTLTPARADGSEGDWTSVLLSFRLRGEPCMPKRKKGAPPLPAVARLPWCRRPARILGLNDEAVALAIRMDGGPAIGVWALPPGYAAGLEAGGASQAVPEDALDLPLRREDVLLAWPR
jgi:hypothetical protein